MKAITPNKYELLPAQQKFMHVAHPAVELDVCVYQGGFGSGKTFIGSLLGIELCRKYPGIRGLVVGKTFPLIRDTTLESYFEHFNTMGFTEKRDFIWKKTEAKLVFPRWGKSEILFRHLEKPYKLKSLNLGWIHVEEMSEIDEPSFFMLLSRLRQTGIPRYRLFGTTNPQPGKNWIYKYFVVRNQGIQSIVQDGREVTVHYRRVIAPSTENRFLSDVYLVNMKNQFDEAYYRVNVLGEDGDYNAGLVCRSWSDANIEETAYRETSKIYLSCDFNVDPMCWALAHRHNGEYFFFDELCIENTTVMEAAQEFARRYSGHQAGIIITGDASGQNRTDAADKPNVSRYKILANTLSNLGFTHIHLDLQRANPYIASRVESWNALVCNADGVRRIKVDPRCKWLIYNCRNLKYVPGSSVIWEPTSKQIERHPELKFVKHIWDAASYLVARYDSVLLEVSYDDKRRNRIVAKPFGC